MRRFTIVTRTVPESSLASKTLPRSSGIRICAYRAGEKPEVTPGRTDDMVFESVDRRTVRVEVLGMRDVQTRCRGAQIRPRLLERYPVAEACDHAEVDVVAACGAPRTIERGRDHHIHSGWVFAASRQHTDDAIGLIVDSERHTLDVARAT
jgi:hypothetical protein